MQQKNEQLDLNLNEFIGLRIQSIRLELGLSQEDLGAMIGVHRTYLGQVERGERNITLRTLEKICDSLGIKLNDFFDISKLK